MINHNEWEREMSAEFSGMMDGIRSEPVDEKSVQRSIEAAEAIAMTKAALQRGRINAAICAMIMWPISGLIAYGISKQFNVSMILAFSGVCCGVFAIIFPFLIASSLRDRVRAGRVLLDCGPFPARKMALGMAVLWFLAAVTTVIVSTDTIAILFAAFLIGFASYWLFMSTGRLRICENGVLQYWNLLRWENIESYRWEGDTDATLMLQAKSKFGFGGRGALPVAIEQKGAVDALLRKHLG